MGFGIPVDQELNQDMELMMSYWFFKVVKCFACVCVHVCVCSWLIILNNF